MYFIHKGSVEVVSEDGQTVFATMSDGAFFGEIALVFRCPRTATIRTTSPCDLFVLSQEVGLCQRWEASASGSFPVTLRPPPPFPPECIASGCLGF